MNKTLKERRTTLSVRLKPSELERLKFLAHATNKRHTVLCRQAIERLLVELELEVKTKASAT